MKFPTFEKAEDVPEAFRDAYEEKDGKWSAKIADPSAELESAVRKEREARKAADDARKKVERELAELKTQHEADEHGVTGDDLKKIREQVRAELETEYAPTKAEAEKYRNENRTLRLDNAIKQQMAKSGVRAERIDALWKLASDRFDLTTDGQPMLRDKPGTALDKYLTDTLKTEFPEFYMGTKADGGGAGGIQRNGAGASKMTHEEFSKLSPTEKMRVAREAEKKTA